jgi:hypothetical protein
VVYELLRKQPPDWQGAAKKNRDLFAGAKGSTAGRKGKGKGKAVASIDEHEANEHKKLERALECAKDAGRDAASKSKLGKILEKHPVTGLLEPLAAYTKVLTLALTAAPRLTLTQTLTRALNLALTPTLTQNVKETHTHIWNPSSRLEEAYVQQHGSAPGSAARASSLKRASVESSQSCISFVEAEAVDDDAPDLLVRGEAGVVARRGRLMTAGTFPHRCAATTKCGASRRIRMLMLSVGASELRSRRGTMRDCAT